MTMAMAMTFDDGDDYGDGLGDAEDDDDDDNYGDDYAWGTRIGRIYVIVIVISHSQKNNF